MVWDNRAMQEARDGIDGGEVRKPDETPRGPAAATLTLWLGRVGRHRATIWLLLAAVLTFGLAYRTWGLGRSLWQDEAWVANSVTAETLPAMVYQSPFAQTSPPLFLLLSRASALTVGVSEAGLRLAAWLAGLCALGLMYPLARRRLGPRLARLAWAMLALAPVAIEYSKTMKQYSLELAATAALLLVCFRYLERPVQRRYLALLAAVAVAPLAAYSSAFLLPGIVLAVVWCGGTAGTEGQGGGLRRGILLAGVAGCVLLLEYFALIRMNSPDSLRQFWKYGLENQTFFEAVRAAAMSQLLHLPGFSLISYRPGVGTASAVGFWLWCGAGVALAAMRPGEARGRALCVQAVCLTPMVLLSVASGLHLYPMGGRLSLFLLPAIILLLLANFRTLCALARLKTRARHISAALDAAVAGGLALALCGAMIEIQAKPPDRPEEDIAAAMRHLKSHAGASDVVWVHASCREGYALYAGMLGWKAGETRYGNTGWPCCMRHIPTYPGTGDATRLLEDFRRAAPDGFAGHIWLLYTARKVHWRFVGLNEPQIMEQLLASRGCVAEETPGFRNVGLRHFACGAVAARPGG